VCNLCNGAVQFILKREAQATLLFAALQGNHYLKTAGHPPEETPGSILFFENGIWYKHSDAVLRISRYLGQPWRFLGYAAYIVPRFLRDIFYRFIAHNRYRWFGKREACYLPTPELKKRFLD
jgi:predicted DCC family thiol-disulfide oxidoreductase YuxK